VRHPDLDRDTPDHRPIVRHRTSGETYWDTETVPVMRPEKRPWPEYVHRLVRLCVVLAVGGLVTGVGIELIHGLRGADRSGTAAAVATTASAAPTRSYGDPPWTVPRPTSTRATVTPGPRSTSATPRTARTSASPTPTRAPVLLGLPGADTLQATLTAYCAQVRGASAVAALGEGDWACRNAERTTALDMDAVCRWIHGDDAWSATLDDDDPNSWRCFKD
jgi:hypothetical protein